MDPTPEPDTSPTRIERVKAVAAPFLLILAVAGLISAIALPTPFAAKPRPADQPAEFAIPVPEFSLTDRSGRTVTKQDLLGKVWVASFIFTKCKGPCPEVTANVRKLQNALDLANSDDVRLVSMTVDPARDTPAVLAKYAENYDAHPTRWLFLTGEQAALYKLINGGFKLLAEPTKAVNPAEGQEIDHSSMMAVVDKSGTIRGVFNGYIGPNDAGGQQFEDGQRRLRELVAELRK